MPGEPAVGVVGLGNMGGVLAERAARGGAVAGFDAAEERREEAAARAGVAIAESAAAVAEAVDVLVLSMTRPEACRRVVGGGAPVAEGVHSLFPSLPRPEASGAFLEKAPEPLGEGGLVIETSTVGPA